jgi:hypothetical protein
VNHEFALDIVVIHRWLRVPSPGRSRRRGFRVPAVDSI